MTRVRLSPEEQATWDLQQRRGGGLLLPGVRVRNNEFPEVGKGWDQPGGIRPDGGPDVGNRDAPSRVLPAQWEHPLAQPQPFGGTPPAPKGSTTPDARLLTWESPVNRSGPDSTPQWATVQLSRPGQEAGIRLTAGQPAPNGPGVSTGTRATTPTPASEPRRTEARGAAKPQPERTRESKSQTSVSRKPQVTPDDLEITPGLGLAPGDLGPIRPTPTRVYGGGVEIVYDPFERREIRSRNFGEHARDFLPSIFGGEILPTLRETREIYRQAQLRGELPPAPELSADRDTQAEQFKLLHDLQDLLNQYDRQVVTPEWTKRWRALPQSQSGVARANAQAADYGHSLRPEGLVVADEVLAKQERQVLREIAARFNPAEFSTWLAQRKQKLHPYQQQALPNLLGWKAIERLREPELQKVATVALITNMLGELFGGPLANHVLSPALARLGAIGMSKLKGRAGVAIADGVKQFGTSNAGKTALQLHETGLRSGGFGTIQFPAHRFLSGQSEAAIKKDQNKPRAVALETLNLMQSAGWGLGLGYATGATLRGLGKGLGAGLDRMIQALDENPALARVFEAYSWPYDAAENLKVTGPAKAVGEPVPKLPVEFKSTKHAVTVYRAATGQFEKVDPDTFGQQFGKNRASESLTSYTLDELQEQRLFKLSGADIYYGLKTIKQHPITGNSELDIVSVMNNEAGLPGVATPAVLLHAIENGASTLDAWDVQGFLPGRYQRFGFQEIGRSAYDVRQFGEPSRALQDAWRTMGWQEGQPYPDVVFMKYGGRDGRLAPRPDQARAVYFRTGSLDPRRIHPTARRAVGGLRGSDVLPTGATRPPGVQGSEGYHATGGVRAGVERSADVLTGDAFTRQYRALQALSDEQLRALDIEPSAVRPGASPIEPGSIPKWQMKGPIPSDAQRVDDDPEKRKPKARNEGVASHTVFSRGDQVEFLTREGKLKTGRIERQNADGTYRLSNGIASAPAARLRPLAPPSAAGSGAAKRPRPAAARPLLVVGTPVEYQRASGTARRSVIVGVNPDGTYQLRNGITRADPKGLRVLSPSAAPVTPR